MRKLCHSIIYPYISYAILAWGSVYKSHIKKIQTKQNHAIRLIFFAHTFDNLTDSALPFLNLLDVLTVNNVYVLHHTLKLPIFTTKVSYQICFKIIFNMRVVFMVITPDMLSNKIYINLKSELVLENKQLPFHQLFIGILSQ